MSRDELSEKDLVNIRKAISAYIAHLAPSANYVKEIDEWRDALNLIQFKIGNILMHSRRTM